MAETLVTVVDTRTPRRISHNPQFRVLLVHKSHYHVSFLVSYLLPLVIPLFKSRSLSFKFCLTCYCSWPGEYELLM